MTGVLVTEGLGADIEGLELWSPGCLDLEYIFNSIHAEQGTSSSIKDFLVFMTCISIPPNICYI